ncbi:MAG: thiamine phosphate synthase [Flavobacteriales bacterium]|nr:thiamine phosphate synthase [Flavobacteriales bacterium]
MISKFQYITGNGTNEQVLIRIRDYCRAGGQWVQLRAKDRPFKQLLELATQARSICSHNNAKLIINDHPDIARAVNAFGVHLGKEDMSASQARKVLFDHQIIGSTCNSWEDIHKIFEEGNSDYIGLGPYRETQTKAKLSPILGLDGLRQILLQKEMTDNSLPIVIVGGIQEPDLEEIYDTGIYAVAASSMVENSKDVSGLVKRIEKITEQELDHAKFETSW